MGGQSRREKEGKGVDSARAGRRRRARMIGVKTARRIPAGRGQVVGGVVVGCLPTKVEIDVWRARVVERVAGRLPVMDGLAGQFVLGGRVGSPLLAGARVGGWRAKTCCHGGDNITIQLHRHRHRHEHRHTAVADGNIDTCGARAVTAATTFDPTAAVRREGKGKASTSHRVITSTTHKPPPPSFSHTADRGELVGLACAVREEWPGCSLLPRAFICVWTCPKSSEWPGVLQQTPHTIRHEPLRNTSRAR